MAISATMDVGFRVVGDYGDCFGHDGFRVYA